MNGTAGEKHMPAVMTPVPASTHISPGILPLSFVVGVSGEEFVTNNFEASPCLCAARSSHQVILMRGGPKVIDKLDRGLEQADNGWVVCLHQDVWLPTGWDRRLVQQIQEAERRYGPIGVAGVYGIGEALR